MLVARILSEQRGNIEALGVSQLCINIYCDTQIRAIPGRFEEPLGQFTSQVDEAIVPCFGDYQDGSHGSLNWAPLQLLGYLAYAGCRLHES